MPFQSKRSRLARADRRLIPNSARAAGALLLLALAAPSQAQVALTTLDTPYAQDFDSLPATGSSTWTDNSSIPGWYLARVGTPVAPYTVVANAGAGNTGAFYSYGTGTATERALGSAGSNASGDQFYGVRFVNNTAATITSLDVAYTGEQWRNGGNANFQSLVFSYVTGAAPQTNLSSAGTLVPALDFASPIASATAAALDGNAAANRLALSATISGLSVAPGEEILLRWKDANDSGNDHGLAVDNLSVTPHGAATQPALGINDVSVNEGDSGTTTATFTVTLSPPAGPGGVTFDIATADGTASAGSDYVANSLTGQTIPAGSTSYTFNVTVNGDTAPEPNETFFVNVTNVTGATVTDGQGQGTIVDNDAPHLSIADVSHNEGNAGTTSYVFTVSLTQPAGAGGVTFDIATADGSATAPSDYTQKALAGQTIPAGSTTYAFTVLVNGDTTSEPDESFNVNVSNVVNASVDDAQAVGTIVNDDMTKIHDVQGNGAATPIAGATVTVEGVVTAEFLGAARLSGFFLQEEDADVDADPSTSEAIFVFCTPCAAGAVTEGQRVRVTGVVSEFFDMTELTPASPAMVVVTDSGNHLAEVSPATISLPVVGDINAYYEAREAMLVTFADTLTVSEFFELPRYGQIELLQGGRSRTFTEDNAPSVAGLAAHLDNLARRRVILDDDNNVQNSVLAQPNGQQAMYWPHQNGGFGVGTQGVDYFRGGDTVSGLTGVLHWSFAGLSSTDAWRIRPTSSHPVTFTPVNTRPATPPDVGGAIRVVGMNLLNYFTTIDTTSSNNSGPCGPGGTLDCRGADSIAELNRQRERASIVICTLNPDVGAFMELENTTPSATITDLLGAVNARCGGAHPYAAVSTGGTLGTDAIRVQIVYRTGVVSTVGAPLVDMDSIHDRPPTAQTFDVTDAANPAFGKRFTVVANHFKSKGSCPASGVDADQGDGQGCWASKRTQQANRLMTWITGTVVPAANDPDVLLLGDFNSYASEDPVVALENGGYADLETVLHGTNAYSYQFDGELGHLDYAFANASLQSQVTGADAWHINSDEVPSFDYNDEIRDTGEAAQEEKPDGSALTPPRVVWQPNTPYRASDHDPVLVGLFGTTQHTVTAAVGTGTGTITPPSVVVNDGATTAFTVTAGTGFHIDTVTGCGGSLAGNTYTTGAITADCTVTANFAPDGGGSPLLTIDLSVANRITITAAGGTSAATRSGPTSTGFYFQDFFANTGTLPLGTATIVGTATLTAASVAPDGSPDLFRGTSGADAGLNVWSYSGTATTTFTAGQVAFAGSATWSVAPAVYAAMLTAPTSGNVYFPADDSSDIASATLLGTYSVTGGGPATHTVTAVVGAGSGTITPPSAVVNDGATTAFTVTANAGSHIDGVTGCGGSLAGNTYTTGPITADCTVTANFAADGANPPAATVAPTSLSFTVREDQTGTQMLNIANAAGSDALTFAITGQASRAARLLPHVSKNRHAQAVLRSTGMRVARAGGAVHAAPAPWVPVGPDGSVTFQADDGSYENGIAWTDEAGTTQNTSLWLNRYSATGALTIGTVSIEWPNATSAAGDVTGKTVNLVAYYDADADGNPTNAVRLGANTPVTINGPDAFENYPANFVVPGAGDVYLGFVDTFAAGGTTPVLYSAALDEDGNPNVGWVAAMSTGDADVDVLGNNDNIGTLDALSNGGLAGVWMVRGTTTGGGATCAGAAVAWLAASPANGTVAGGANTDVAITADPSADDLAPGSYTATLCIATNDPAHAMIAVPVALTVTPAPVVPCSAADTIFCDGFDPAAAFVQPVQDPGFEATTDDGGTNPEWDSDDSNLDGGGSIFYSASGFDVPTHDGEFTAWFGGWDAGAETQHFAQSVTLPSGGPLYLNYWRFVAGGPDVPANLVVSVDGVAVQTTDLSTQLDDDYVLQSIDVTAYADGGVHVIRFEYDYDGTGSTDGNTFVDDVTIDRTQAPMAH
ncbi:MAG: ExeM/NucH family extracellular endonuclease [Dokdonella sp.]|uniref:ExeM/NucH family extracellular endonuclease n=1 Tax=Dokdonella sp. TaxID=2291710 RepID=UPI003F818EEC